MALNRRKKIQKIDEENLLSMIQQTATDIDEQGIKVDELYNRVRAIIGKTEDETTLALLGKLAADYLKLKDNNISSRLKLSKIMSDHQKVMVKQDNGLDVNNLGLNLDEISNFL